MVMGSLINQPALVIIAILWVGIMDTVLLGSNRKYLIRYCDSLEEEM